jgi:Fe-S-cluster-containing dehydrogenase component
MSRLEVVDAQRCTGCQLCMFACNRRQGIVGLDASCIGIRSAGGMSRGFVVVVCRACPDPPCAKVCPVEALIVRPEGGVHLDRTRCIGCHNCQQACTLGAVFWDRLQEKPSICIYCGLCADSCPHGVIRMEQTETAHAAG